MNNAFSDIDFFCDTDYCITMKTASVRDLRNHFAELSTWIESGETIQLTKRGVAYAQIIPVIPLKVKFKFPNFSLRAKRIAKGTVIDLDGILKLNQGRF